VTGYVEGQTLEEALKFQKLTTERQLRDIVLPLPDGLEQIHATGFIHRDIKHENIFVQSDGTAVLLDFGSARQALSEHTQP
jgi:serine/threonine protein kinase